MGKCLSHKIEKLLYCTFSLTNLSKEIYESLAIVILQNLNFKTSTSDIIWLFALLMAIEDSKNINQSAFEKYASTSELLT